ncbi:MAG: VOC family protein [Bdellovibrionota bacterium]
MSKIVPHLWFDKEAQEAVEFYTSIFPNSKVTNLTTVEDTPSGNCDVVSFELWDRQFMAISAGSLFKFNPSISFLVNIDSSQGEEAKKQLDYIWDRLSEGGRILMPLGKYPFSERYGWIQDRYGLSWQLILSDPNGDERPSIIPSLLFVDDRQGQAAAAGQFYQSVFKNTKAGQLLFYGANQEPNKEGTVMFSDFRLENTWFIAMDAGLKHDFTFNESISFVVNCNDQEEINYYWENLSAVPEAEQCGWVKDKFGISWQIIPAVLSDMMACGNQERVKRVAQAFLKMKKFNIDELQKAYRDEL